MELLRNTLGNLNASIIFFSATLSNIFFIGNLINFDLVAFRTEELIK